MLLEGDQIGRANERCLYALNDGVTFQVRADRPAHGRFSPIAPDEIARGDAGEIPGVEVANRRYDLVAGLLKTLDLCAVQDRDQPQRLRVAENHRLEKNLIGAMRGLGRRPMAIGAALVCEPVAPARNANARELHPGERCPIGDVVWIVCRQANIAQQVRDAQAPIDLHRSRRDVIALRLRRLAGVAPLDDHHLDAAPREIHGERQADGARANDKHTRFCFLVWHVSR